MRLALLLSAVLALQATPPSIDQAPVRIGGSIPPPQKIKDVKPAYPAEAQQAHVQGMVVIEATIDPSGKVRDAVVRRSIPFLDQAALDAVRQWEYTPTIVNGQPVAVIMTVTVNFWLQSPGGASGVSGLSPPVPPMIRLTSSKTQDGTTTVWEITPARARSLPRWNPDDASPLPLSVADAVQTAQKWATDRSPQTQRFELQSVTLSRIRRSADIDFWHYLVDLFGYGMPQSGGPLTKVVILLDRSIVEPAPQTVGETPGQVAPPTQLPPGVYRVGPGITLPRVVHEVKPNYTSEALRQKISGSVLVECVVDTDGVVHDVRVVRSLDAAAGLDDEAIKAEAMAVRTRHEGGPGRSRHDHDRADIRCQEIATRSET